MPGKPHIKDRAEGLRRRAEQRAGKPGRSSIPHTEADALRLVHELEVHQIELEMQNAELRGARDDAEAALEKYSDLYDFAPVGYFTLTSEGRIRLVNLAGSTMVGIERSKLIERPFAMLLPPTHRAGFRIFLKSVFAGDAKQSADFELTAGDEPPRMINIEAQCSPDGFVCSAVVMDITKRHQAEDRVRISEIRYRRLFEAAHDGVLLIDPGTCRITDANPFMTRLLGYSRRQLIGKELFEIGLLKDEVASREMFRRLKKSHEVRYEDLPLESQDGRHQEVEVVANLYQEGGHAVIQCNIRDITDRKLAELTAVRLASIVEFSDDAIIGKDLDGIITNWNQGAENTFGYSAREMVGTSITRLIPSDRPDEENLILAKIRSGRSVEHFETQRRTKDGRLIDVSVTASPIKDANGNVTGVSKVARDISERKKVEEVMRRNQTLFSALIDQAPVGIYVIDARFRLQQANPMAMPVFVNVDPLIGRDFAEIMRMVWPSRIAGEIIGHFRRTLTTGEPYQSPVFVERRRDTRERENYEWQTQRVILPAGEFGVVCFFNNTTERVRAEAARRRLEVLTASNLKLRQEIVTRQAAEEALRKTRQMQSELLKQSRFQQKQLRDLSRGILLAQEDERKRISRELHDVIAQTLVGINVHLAALSNLSLSDPAELRDHIASTHLLVENSVDIVHRFARELRPTMLDDLGLIPALQTFMIGFMEETGIRVSLTASATIERSNGTVRTTLYRIAQEALTNVARHARASWAEVSIGLNDGMIQMEITDNGIGFDPDGQPGPEKSSRLGLLGMRERSEMTGGTFFVISNPGGPTTIRIAIPAGKGGSRKNT